MPVKVITTEKGHSVPPEGPHTVTMHIPGWDTAMNFRSGDRSLLTIMTSIYPRFMPFSLAGKFAQAVHKKLDLPPTHAAFPFVHPEAFQLAQNFTSSEHRKEHKLDPEDLVFKIVAIEGIVLYIVAFPTKKMPGAIGIWQHPGIGISSRLGEYLLPHVDRLTELPFHGDTSLEKLPAPTYLPESAAHQKIRERIIGLLQRAPLTPDRFKSTPDDVFLYPTGMAAIHRIHQAIMQVRTGPVVALGSIFHNTWHLFEEAPAGFKHFGRCDAKSGVLDEFESYLQAEAKEGRKVAYVFVEFPSNPILVSVDLRRLRQLADKYDFYTVVDDTIGSFSNIDVSSVADVIMSSLTKSFSGYADVMSGSIVLNPDSPRYEPLKGAVRSQYHNEFFAGDAEKLLSNSDDYLERSIILNRNASTVAAFLQTQVEDPSSPVVSVEYPEQNDTLANFQAFMRPATPEFTPGYGCLLSVDFETKACAKAFYDNIQFYQGPHLGAHHSLAVPFNELVWGKDPKDLEYHAGYGVRGEQIRLAVGLESEEELVDTVKAALVFATEAKIQAKASA